MPGRSTWSRRASRSSRRPRGGRSFYFRDPAGNSLELATPRIWGLPEIN
jgi:catechol 2,3-dioxygenase-like lactoylglutathione lyase family enzyme